MNKRVKNLSMSTSWCGERYTSGRVMMEDLKEMGFHTVELNYSITEEMAEEIIEMVDNGEIDVSSVHHPFPKVYDNEYDTDSFMLGFKDDVKREKSIELTKRSLDYAHRLGAKALVIHASEVPLNTGKHYDVLLKNLYRAGKKNSPEYTELYQEMISHRNKYSHEYTERTKDSLKILCDYIKEKGYDLVIGIENRAMCHQIPDFYEAEYILDQLEGEPVYYWFDIGHGIMMENLGMFNNMTEMKKILDRTIGTHIHDARGVDDHVSPYIMSNYLDNFLEIIDKIPIKVLELGFKNSREEAIEGSFKMDEKLDSLK